LTADSTTSTVAAASCATYRHDARDPASLGSDDARAVLEDHAGHLWIGTADGLDLLDRATGHFTHYKHDESDAGRCAIHS